jgi:hypothetical protein
MDIEPVEAGDLEEVQVTAPPSSSRGGPRKRRCSPEIRAFMARAVRELEPKEVESTIDIPLERFKVYGLEDLYQTAVTLDSCPESEYVKVEPVEVNDHEVIRLVKLGQPDVKAVKHYSPLRQED